MIAISCCKKFVIVFQCLWYWGYSKVLWPPVWGHSCRRTSWFPLWRCKGWCQNCPLGHETSTLVYTGHVSSTYNGTANIYQIMWYLRCHAGAFTTILFSGNHMFDDEYYIILCVFWEPIHNRLTHPVRTCSQLIDFEPPHSNSSQSVWSLLTGRGQVAILVGACRSWGCAIIS